MSNLILIFMPLCMCRDSSDQDDHRKYLYVHDAEYGATHEFEVVQNDFYERTKFL